MIKARRDNSDSVTWTDSRLASLVSFTKYRVTVKTDLLAKFLYFMGRSQVSYYFKAVNTTTGLV